MPIRLFNRANHATLIVSRGFPEIPDAEAHVHGQIGTLERSFRHIVVAKQAQTRISSIPLAVYEEYFQAGEGAEMSRTLTSLGCRFIRISPTTPTTKPQEAFIDVVDSSILIAICSEVNVRFVCKSKRCLPASSKASE